MLFPKLTYPIYANTA